MTVRNPTLFVSVFNILISVFILMKIKGVVVYFYDDTIKNDVSYLKLLIHTKVLCQVIQI
jgi:hypothetical protein